MVEPDVDDEAGMGEVDVDDGRSRCRRCCSKVTFTAEDLPLMRYRFIFPRSGLAGAMHNVQGTEPLQNKTSTCAVLAIRLHTNRNKQRFRPVVTGR